MTKLDRLIQKSHEEEAGKSYDKNILKGQEIIKTKMKEGGVDVLYLEYPDKSFSGFIFKENGLTENLTIHISPLGSLQLYNFGRTLYLESEYDLESTTVGYRKFISGIFDYLLSDEE